MIRIVPDLSLNTVNQQGAHRLVLGSAVSLTIGINILNFSCTDYITVISSV